MSWHKKIGTKIKELRVVCC